MKVVIIGSAIANMVSLKVFICHFTAHQTEQHGTCTTERSTWFTRCAADNEGKKCS